MVFWVDMIHSSFLRAKAAIPSKPVPNSVRVEGSGVGTGTAPWTTPAERSKLITKLVLPLVRSSVVIALSGSLNA